MESSDFRFFCDWFEKAIERYRFQTENFFDLYDPLRCPEELVWALADTMGYKFDNRLPVAFNRIVLLYFMSMIYNRGSRDGITLAAQTNLTQFNILRRARGYTERIDTGKEIIEKVHEPNDILYNRLEDTSIPVNAVYVTVHTPKGYIDVVYFSDQIPLDACIEYVRPVGMYCFQHAGVRFDAKTRVSIDARLTDTRDVGMSFGPTHVGHYRRRDYASMQLTRQKLDETEPVFRVRRIPNAPSGKYYIQEQLDNGTWTTVFGPFKSERRAKAHFDAHIIDLRHNRENVWYRNRDSESGVFTPPSSTAPAEFKYTLDGESYYMNPGYRSLYNLQLCNNEQIMQSLFKEPIFSLGLGPQDFHIKDYADDYIKYPYRDIYEDHPRDANGNPIVRHDVPVQADGYHRVNQPIPDPENPDAISGLTIDRKNIGREAYVDPDIDRIDPYSEKPNRRAIGRKAFNLRYNRDMEESMLEPNFHTFAIEKDDNDRWFILKDGVRLEPSRTYADARTAEVRLAILAPPDMYTVENKHKPSGNKTDNIGWPADILPGDYTTSYEIERNQYPNLTNARPVVNPPMGALGDSISVMPDIYNNYDGKTHYDPAGSPASPKTDSKEPNTQYGMRERLDDHTIKAEGNIHNTTVDELDGESTDDE